MTKNKKADGQKKWNLIHGVLIYAGVQAATFGLAAIVKRLRKNDSTVEEFYNHQTQPFFAPPDWAFAPAWTINNALCIYGLLRVLNMPEETAGRREFLAFQMLSWADFIIFSAACFSLRSNWNGAVLTNLYLVFTLISVYVALARLKDAKTALSLSTLTAWLALAAPLSVTIAAWNGDEFYGVEPIARPTAGWLKS